MIPTEIAVPRLPPALLRRHDCHEPTDTCYRAAARLAQALWRERRGLACGRHRDAATGRWRRLGSRLGLRPAAAGANLVDPALVPLVRRELAYREPGAAIDERRLWGNMLASQALAFSLVGPLRLNPALATAALGRLAPDGGGSLCGRFPPPRRGTNPPWSGPPHVQPHPKRQPARRRRAGARGCAGNPEERLRAEPALVAGQSAMGRASSR